MGGISKQMLTRTLKTLERDGMVKRSVAITKRVTDFWGCAIQKNSAVAY